MSVRESLSGEGWEKQDAQARGQERWNVREVRGHNCFSVQVAGYRRLGREYAFWNEGIFV